MGESNLKRALKNLGLIFGIVIILYLLLVAFPIARAVRPQMNVRQTKNLLQVMKMGCDAYFKSFGQWPTSLSELYHNRSNIVFVSWAESYTNDAWAHRL